MNDFGEQLGENDVDLEYEKLGDAYASAMDAIYKSKETVTSSDTLTPEQIRTVLANIFSYESEAAHLELQQQRLAAVRFGLKDNNASRNAIQKEVTKLLRSQQQIQVALKKGDYTPLIEHCREDNKKDLEMIEKRKNEFGENNNEEDNEVDVKFALKIKDSLDFIPPEGDPFIPPPPAHTDSRYNHSLEGGEE